MRLSRTYAASRPSRGPSTGGVDVVDDPHAVAEPVGAAPLERLPDRRQPERLAGVDGEVEVLPLQVLERVQVPGGRVAGLGAGDVEADHADVAVPHRQLGDLRRPGGVAHRGQQGADPDRRARRPGLDRAGLEPGQHRLHHLGQLQAALEVLLRGEPHLGVDHAVGGQVEGALPGHPVQRVRCLHDRDGVGERLQVALQRAGVGRRDEPAARPGTSVAGSACPTASASSTIVAGRSPPSR